MQLGMIGLGRMGGNIVRRLMKHGHSTVVYDKDPKAVAALAADGAAGTSTLEDFVDRLERPRTAWVMLPAGKITEATIEALAKLMQPGDVIIDGGNTFWQDDVRRGAALKAKGIHYVDVGTSGGVWGIERGYCMMIGGDKAVVDRLDPIFACLAPGIGDIPHTPGREGRDPRIEQGYIHAGPVGAGHFVKMIHNGIEYGLMQAYAEGFDILKNANSEALLSEHRFDLDIADIAEVWRRGSVIPSWLLDLTASALAENQSLDNYSGFVEDSGEGRWTVNAAIDEAVAERLLECVTCIEADPKDPSSFDHLKAQLERLEAARATGGNRLFYLATPPGAFAPIARELGRVGLLKEQDGAWRRLVVEKPFGTDLASAKALNSELQKLMDEHQIYRIDHYLGKETVQNILVLRFANGMFEPIWNRNHIDHIQITVDEKLGVGHRGSFYDSTGALRDMLPNHLFQLLSLVAMEPPAKFDAHAVRSEKAEVLAAIQAQSEAEA